MAKTIAMIFGIIYTIIGIAGLVPSLGGTYGMAPTMLLGFAQINIVHTIVHLIIGVAGLAMARSEASAMSYCKIFGVILIVVGLLGFVSPTGFGLLPLGGSDIWLHLVSGIILAIGGWATAPSGRTATT
jgi:hypothetical protein